MTRLHGSGNQNTLVPPEEEFGLPRVRCGGYQIFKTKAAWDLPAPAPAVEPPSSWRPSVWGSGGVTALLHKDGMEKL